MQDITRPDFLGDGTRLTTATDGTGNTLDVEPTVFPTVAGGELPTVAVLLEAEAGEAFDGLEPRVADFSALLASLEPPEERLEGEVEPVKRQAGAID